MATNINGGIFFRDDTGQCVSASPQLLRKYSGSWVKNGFYIEKGSGEHPLVNVQISFAAFGGSPFSEISGDVANLVAGSKEGDIARNVFDILGIPEYRRQNYLYVHFQSKAFLKAFCIAANESGVILVEWDRATNATFMQQNIMYAFHGAEPFLAAVPKDLLPENLPSQRTCVGISYNEKYKQDINISALMQGKMLLNVGAVTQVTGLVPAGVNLRDREKALIDLGIQAETYNGPRPQGIRHQSVLDPLVVN